MATVIKAGEKTALLKRLSTVDLADHLKEADAVVAAAMARATRIVAEAESRAEKMCEHARRAGYDAGYNEGRQAGEAAGHEMALKMATERFEHEHATIVADLVRATNEIDRIKEDLRVTAERDLLEFAVRIASKMTFAVGRLHREAVAGNIRRAIRQVGEKTDLTIHLNPLDKTYMDTFAHELLGRLDGPGSFQLIEDSSIAPGGCLVKTDRTSVDATLETQVAQIVSLLLGDELSQEDHGGGDGLGT